MEDYLQYVLSKVKTILDKHNLKYETSFDTSYWINIDTDYPLSEIVSKEIVNAMKSDIVLDNWELNENVSSDKIEYSSYLFNFMLNDSIDKYKSYIRREGLKSLFKG